MSDPAEIVQRNRTLASVMEVDPGAESIYGWVYRYDVDAEARRPPGAASVPLERPEAQRAWSLWATMLGPRDLDRQHHGIREAYDRFLLENFPPDPDRKSTRLNSSHVAISYAVFCLKKKNTLHEPVADDCQDLKRNFTKGQSLLDSLICSFFFLEECDRQRDLHSFPTRRSSD